jgi:hypothetical protein
MTFHSSIKTAAGTSPASLTRSHRFPVPVSRPRSATLSRAEVQRVVAEMLG